MTPESLVLLADYALRLAPGAALFALALALLPRRALGPRIALYIALFILIRDAMTPVGLWQFDGLRIGFYPSGLALALLGLASLAGVAFLWAVERDLRALLVWRRGGLVAGAVLGIGTGIALAVPSWLLAGPTDPAARAGPGFLVGLGVLAYGGNLLEEVLFRGYLQARLAAWTSELRAALLSGLIFGACHSYLALTVTDAGWPILAFTTAEGVACGLVRLRHGVLGAALAHGTAIFAISGPMT